MLFLYQCDFNHDAKICIIDFILDVDVWGRFWYPPPPDKFVPGPYAGY